MTAVDRIEERSVLCQLIEKALACKACLTEVVDFALAYHDEDLSIIVEKLSVAMKVPFALFWIVFHVIYSVPICLSVFPFLDVFQNDCPLSKVNYQNMINFFLLEI